MDRVIIGVDPHKLSVTIEARDNREILRATGRFGTDARSYRRRRHLRREQTSARPRTSTWHRQMSQPEPATYGDRLRANARIAAGPRVRNANSGA